MAKLPMLNLAPSYDMFFMLNSTEHEVLTAQIQMLTKTFLAFKLLDAIFIVLTNFQMPIGILTFMSMINFMLN